MLLFACADSAYFLSDSERDELYGLDLFVAGLRMPEAVLLVPGAAIKPTMSLAKGVPAPASLSLELVGVEGESAKRSSFIAGAGSSVPDESSPLLGHDVTVESLLEPLPSLIVPSGLEPGAYYLELRALDRDGMERASISRPVFLASRDPAEASIAVYPGVVRPGGMLLLVADFDDEGFDPWVRWSAQGVVLAEGYASKGFDRLLWRAPLEPVASALAFEWFPFAPHRPGLEGVLKEKVSILVPAKANLFGDEFLDSDGFVRLFHLDGDLLDSTGGAEAETNGSPVPDAWSGGLGYRFGQGEGFAVPVGAVPLNAAFSLVSRLALDRDAVGRVIGIEGDADEIAVVVREGRLFLEAPGHSGEGALAGPPVPARPFTLVTSVLPVGKRFLVSWQLDGLPAAASFMDADAATTGPFTRFSVGGAAGLYDEAGLWSKGDARTVYPAWARRQVAEHGTGLLEAEGFESLSVPDSFGGSSGLVSGPEGLVVDRGEVAWLARAFPALPPFRVRFEGDASLALAVPGGEALVAISADGVVRKPDGGVAGVLDPSGGYVVWVDRGVLNVSSDGSSPLAVCAFAGTELAVGFGGQADRSMLRRVSVLAEKSAESVRN